MCASARRERIIRILCTRGLVSVSTLANELEVSPRTIERDISILSLTKPISTLSGRNGGVFILNTYGYDMSMCSYELWLLNKIIDECEKNESCSLRNTELSALKDIVAFYSGMKKRKEKENEYEKKYEYDFK